MSSLLPTPREDLLDYAGDSQDGEQPSQKFLAKTSGKIQGEDVSGPPSPPTSPPKPTIATEAVGESYADPPLYAEDRTSSSHTNTPLFPQENAEDLIERHIDARKQSPSLSGNSPSSHKTILTPTLGSSTLPTVDDYKLATTFVSILHRQNARLLFKETMAENAKYYHLAKHPRNPGAPAKLKLPSHISWKATKPVRPLKPSVTSQKKSKQHPNRVIKPAPRHQRASTPIAFTTPVSGKSPVVKKTTDRDFEKYADVSPSVELLGNKSDAFTFTKWTGKPLDLSTDPHRHLLHPSELKAAEALRLECDRWLVTKRMIFQGALECYRAGKEFKKTDAQKATVIDVNKASKIWEAFNSVGWFDPKHFARF